jgi:hypothetical protein
MFASRVKKIVELKDGDGIVYVTIRKLSARSLERAAEVSQASAMKSVSDVGPGMMQAIREAGSELKKADDPKRALAARYGAYDRASVIRAGVESWTATDVPVETGVDDLDEEATAFLHREIVDLSLPSVEVTAEAGKVDAGLSTSY